MYTNRLSTCIVHKDKAKKRQIFVHCTGPVYATKMGSGVGEGDRFIIVLSVSNTLYKGSKLRPLCVHVDCLALYLSFTWGALSVYYSI